MTGQTPRGDSSTYAGVPPLVRELFQLLLTCLGPNSGQRPVSADAALRALSECHRVQ